MAVNKLETQPGGNGRCVVQSVHLVFWLALTVNLTKPGNTWEDSLSEELPSLGWSVGVYVGDCLN